MEINLLHGDRARSRRPGVPVQAHGARGGAAPQDVRHVHGQAACQASRAAPCTSTRAWSTAKTRQEHVQRRRTARPRQLFFAHIAGLQKYLPAAMALFAPNVNSYRRITRYQLAPINVQWGYDNRTAGLRVPVSDAESAPRREPRSAAPTPIPTSRSRPRWPAAISAWSRACSRPSRSPAARTTCRSRCRARSTMRCAMLREMQAADRRCSASPSCRPTRVVKEAEHEVFLQVISSWEREHLLLNVVSAETA